MAQKKKTKTKKEKEKMKNITKGVVSGILIASIMLNALFFVNIQFSILATSNGDFNVHLMGLSIDNPYDASEKVVVFSDDNGNPYVDGTRTNWKESDLTYWEAFSINEGAAAKPYILNDIVVGDVNHPIGWVNAPQTNFNGFAKGNSWYATSGCTVDPDAEYTGVPDLSISISNLYASNSNGELDETYSYEKTTRTLVDEAENTREIEIHSGFVTLEVTFSVGADYTLFSNKDVLAMMVGETDAYFRSSLGRMWSTLGAGVGFNAVLRIQIGSLQFDDDWELNPGWINFGNGILGVNKRGFGVVEDTDGDIYTIGTQDTVSWMFGGNNDIEEHQNDQLQKYSSKERAIDKSDALTDDSTFVVDFKEQNPETVYIALHNYVALGMDYEPNVLGSMVLSSLQIQKLSWVQRITVQFYTSIAEPLAGENIDPITHLITFPDVPPKERLWDRIVNWVSELLGVNRAMAQLIIIASIIGITILIVLILLAIFAPQVYPMMAKAIAGFFKRRATKKALSRQ